MALAALLCAAAPIVIRLPEASAHGWPALIPMILMASVIGAVVGIAMKFSSGLREGGYIPFGPFLAGAGLTAMFFGPQTILNFIGL